MQTVTATSKLQLRAMLQGKEIERARAEALHMALRQLEEKEELARDALTVQQSHDYRMYISQYQSAAGRGSKGEPLPKLLPAPAKKVKKEEKQEPRQPPKIATEKRANPAPRQRAYIKRVGEGAVATCEKEEGSLRAEPATG